MQWLIDIIIEFLRDNGYLLPAYIDRGDPAAFDFQLADFTRDGAWHDLDLSAIIPAGAQAVVFRISYRDFVTGKWIQFRKNGNTNTRNMVLAKTNANVGILHRQYIVALDTDRVIEYLFTPSPSWFSSDFVVMGWIL